MIEQMLAAVAQLQPALEPMLAQAGGGGNAQDVWAPLNAALRALVVGACSLGLTIGAYYKFTERDGVAGHTWTNVVMGASIGGLFIALMAIPIANAFISAT